MGEVDVHPQPLGQFFVFREIFSAVRGHRQQGHVEPPSVTV